MIQSKLGDKLDHYSDIIFTFFLTILIISEKNGFYMVIPFILYFLFFISISCQQKLKLKNNKNHKDSLSFIANIFDDKILDCNNKFFKIFGYGFMTISLSLYIFFWDLLK